MEFWLAGGFLPLLLLAWLPAGESPLASALNSSLFVYTCRGFGTWLLLLFPLLLQHLTPLLHQHLATCLAEGSPPANACAQAVGSAPGDPISGAKALN